MATILLNKIIYRKRSRARVYVVITLRSYIIRGISVVRIHTDPSLVANQFKGTCRSERLFPCRTIGDETKIIIIAEC